MTDAPEKIWAGPSLDDKGVFWDVGHWDADFDKDCIEYTRTDISQARIAQLEAALEGVLPYVKTSREAAEFAAMERQRTPALDAVATARASLKGTDT